MPQNVVKNGPEKMTNTADLTEAEIKFLRRAIANAVANVEQGNRPFAAILVGAEGDIMAEDCDRTVLSGDPFSHGEVNVLRTAIQKFGLERVMAATLYVNGEPCPMCAGTILRSGIGRVIYAATGAMAGPYLGGKFLGRRLPSDAIFALAGDDLKVTSGVLVEEARRPFELYAAKGAA
jgi:tRNA(Arg) A34 adenosine deaminase TadA